MRNQQYMLELVRDISGQANVLTIPRIYLKLLDGDLAAALLLGQIVYWSDRTKRTDGWFYKSYREWEDEICLSYHQVSRAAKELERLGVVECDVRKANGAPTVHYRLIPERLAEAIIEFFDNQESAKSDIAESAKSDIAESAKSLTLDYTLDYSLNYAEKNIFSPDQGGDGNAGDGGQPESCEPSQVIEPVIPVETTLIDGKPAEDFFAELAASKPKKDVSPPISVEERKARTLAALDRFYERTGAEIEAMSKIGINRNDSEKIYDFVRSGVREDCKEVALEFCKAFGRAPLKGERKAWNADFETLVGLGITGSDVARACTQMAKDGLVISRPMSVRANAEKCVKDRKKTAAKSSYDYIYSPEAEKYRGPDGKPDYRSKGS